jgi:ribose 1,5-bisphosphate isomerase
MNDKLTAILNDNQSGSIEITKKSLQYFKEIIDQNSGNTFNPENLYSDLQETAKQLLKKYPNMVMLRKTCNNLVTYLKRLLKTDKNSKEILSNIYSKLDQIETELEGNINKIAQTGSRIIAPNNRVMTISNSTMVRLICLQTYHQKRKFEVIALKSHPPDEGIYFAETLANQGIKTTVVPDSAMGSFIPDVNLVLLGADRIYENGFVNKSGTLPLCLAARQFNIPVYLAVDTSKILKESERAIKIVSQDKQEVYSGKKKHFDVENIYFEKIPLNLVHKIICEDGVFEFDEFINWYLKE